MNTRMCALIAFFSLFFAAVPAASDEYYKNGVFTEIGETSGLGSKNVTCLAVNEKEKALYIGTADRGVFIYGEDEAARPYLQAPALPSDSVLSICYDEKDEMLAVGTNSGLAIIQKPLPGGAGAVKIFSTAESRVPSNTVFSLFIADNVVYAGTEHGVFTVANGRLDRIAVVSSPGVEIGKVNSVFVDGSGPEKTIFVASDTSLLKTSDMVRFENAGGAASRMKCPGFVRGMEIRRRSGDTIESELVRTAVAVLSIDGMTVLSEKGGFMSFSADDGLPENWLTCFANDRLDKGAPATDEASLKSGVFKKGLWVGTKNSGVCAFDGSRFVVFNTENSPLASNRIADVAAGTQSVYVATPGGLFRYGLVEPPGNEKPVEQIFVGRVNALETAGETLYIAACEGVYAYRTGEKPVRLFPSEPGLRDANALCVNDSGTLFAATKRSGVVAVDREKLVRLDKDGSGLPSNNCTAICAIGGGSVVAGFGDATGCVSGKCVTIGPDYQVRKFEPLADASPAAYDLTSNDSRAAVAAFLPLREGILVGMGYGDPKSLVHYSGSDWSYYETKGFSFDYVSSITRMPGGGIAVAGRTADDRGVVVSADGTGGWKAIDSAGGSRVFESVCAVKDSATGGLWVYLKYLNPTSRADSLLCFESDKLSYSMKIRGTGTAFARLNRHVFCANTNGVMKVLKK